MAPLSRSVHCLSPCTNTVPRLETHSAWLSLVVGVMAPVALWSTSPMEIRHKPEEPQVTPPPPLPWVAALTPLVFAVVMALVFQQALALMMGLIGPLMVLGSWWEGRRQASQNTASTQKNYQRAVEQYSEEISHARRKEKADSLRRLPALLDAVGQPLWRRTALTELGVRLGLGWANIHEGHALAGTGGIAGMPMVLDPARAVAVVGDERSIDVWRLIAVSWILASTTVVSLSRQGELPETVTGLSLATWVRTPDDVPEQCEVVILCGEGSTCEVRGAAGQTVRVSPDRLSHAQAWWILGQMKALEDDAAVVQRADYSRIDQVWCSLSDDGPEFDVVREGPHVVVWGATGSGKSVTVTSLVGRLAQRYPPERVVCVLIDFKGGAGLRDLWDLPHTVGSITDMEGVSATRALLGLHAELLRREKILHQSGVTDVSGLDPGVSLPRLIVVIDEVAWLLENFPTFQSALSDVLARGRSLGVHVVLSTQRITGVLSHAMMANISLRICGRVSDEAEALSWIPDLGAAKRHDVRHLLPGTVVLSGASSIPRSYAVTPWNRQSISGIPSTWRVWAPPLPDNVLLTPHSWGLADDMPAQTHRVLGVADNPEGSLLIVGDARMGKSTALMTFASMQTQCHLAPHEPLLLWLWWQAQTGRGHTLLLDNIDRTLSLAGLDGAQFLLDMLEGSPERIMMSTSGSSKHYRSLSRLVQSELVLYLDKADTRIALGGVDIAAPGRARFRGEIIQVACGAVVVDETAVHRSTPAPGSVIVTRKPERFGGDCGFPTYTPEQLASRWHEVAESRDIVLDGVSPLEIRGATAGRIHPPPLPVPEELLLFWRGGDFLVTTKAWWTDSQH